MAIVSNLTIDQGTTFKADIDVTDASGNALNLTGYTTAGQMRKSYASDRCDRENREHNILVP